MNQYNYVVSAQKPTAVSFSVKGNFLSPNEQCLIVSKGSRIEVFRFDGEKLKLVVEFGIWGRVASLKLYHTTNRPTAELFVLTEQSNYCILSYDDILQQVVTECSGQLAEIGAKAYDDGSVVDVDDSGRIVCTSIYLGMIRFLQLNTGVWGENMQPIAGRSSSKGKEVIGKRISTEVGISVNMRFQETNIISCCFLPSMSLPTLAILYQDAHEDRHVTSYVVNVRTNSKAAGIIPSTNVEPGANLLIAAPPPYNGLIVVGEQSIMYLQPMNPPITIYMDATVMKAHEVIDASRILLGDYLGRLYLLILLVENQHVKDIHLEKLGEISAPTSLSYLGDGVLFVGSAYGDSQLAQLNTDKNDEGDYVTILDEMTNLGPITDFALVDIEKQGQAQVITCSGAGSDGSLRIIRNGVGVHIQASLEIVGVKNVLSLRPAYNSNIEDKLVISFIEQTRVLRQIEDELHEIEHYSGFCLTRTTLATTNTVDNHVVQITDQSVRLFEISDNGNLLDELSAEENARITIATTNARRCAFSTGEGTLNLLEYKAGKLERSGSTKLANEIACIHINQFPLAFDDDVIVVGYWTTMRTQLLSARDLSVIASVDLGGDIIPRSILLTEFEKELFLLVALGDGQLFNFQVDPLTLQLSNQKKVSIGTQPVTLNTFSAGGATHVFAASDRPTVIHSSNHKILYSDVNLKDMSNITAFRNPSFENCIAFTTSSGVMIGQIDQVQKLHINKIPLGEMARRICYQESTRTFAIITTKMETSLPDSSKDSSIKILDDQSFEILDTLTLESFEVGESIASCSFDGGASDFYIVGTATVVPGDEDVRKGRILVLQVSPERKLILRHTRSIDGSPYCIQPMDNKLVVAVNGTIGIYEWINHGLSNVCCHRSNTIVVDMAVNGNQIVVADLMRSISKLVYDKNSRTIRELAIDQNSNWMASLSLVDDNIVIGAEVGYNLFTLAQIPNNTMDDTDQFEVIGEWHLGEYVNRFRKGSLVMNHSDTTTTSSSTLFGTINGVLGVMHNLTADQYLLFSQVESNIIHIVGSIGHFDHSKWRNFRGDRRVAPHRGFIDGDLIESFLDLNRSQMQQVVDGDMGGQRLNCSLEQLFRIIEEFSRLH
ncbi:hypothetical protein K450DRAFT_220087 [Umbelopsis ramanniana AG]|uniref:DNA damage-binding protein 1 n=1 Tax=Umbelopsis ramanniana AG TaxID=1314678 RepID=A0AAD5EJ26_UMBRA|nr:uncharacterized protein K450DRAFT_220087 [Umbelopsis ramanniana AG]KAI8583811.1 hypothetical protein K450DRAFT_220087 [Umbelopsis ramanniana AG]